MTKSYHTTFGGIIYDSDFNTNYKKGSSSRNGSDIAAIILRDRSFDEQCRRQLQNRDSFAEKYLP